MEFELTSPIESPVCLPFERPFQRLGQGYAKPLIIVVHVFLLELPFKLRQIPPLSVSQPLDALSTVWLVFEYVVPTCLLKGLEYFVLNYCLVHAVVG